MCVQCIDGRDDRGGGVDRPRSVVAAHVKDPRVVRVVTVVLLVVGLLASTLLVSGSTPPA